MTVAAMIEPAPAAAPAFPGIDEGERGAKGCRGGLSILFKLYFIL
jgi:hypothetical protein